MKHFKDKLPVILFLLAGLCVATCYASGDEVHMGPEQPFKTFSAALNALPNGGTIFIEGELTEYEQKIKIQNRYYPTHSPLIVDGQNKTISHQPIAISDSANVVVKNLTCFAGCGLESSQKDYSKVLQYVTLKNIVFKYGRIFAGGYSYHDITVQDCTVQEVIYSGKETHGIYFSGGHWSGSVGMPHPNNINIIGNTIRWAGGRHGIQVNGCFDSVRVKGNTIYCNAFTGFQGIGINGCEVSHNTILLGNRGCINIYDYWDGHYWDPSGPAATDLWRQCHHPNDKWHVHHNTFLVGPTEWCWWQGTNHVKDRPAILINNEMAGVTFEWPDLGIYGYEINYEPTYHWIHDNVLVSPWSNIIEYHDSYSPWVTHVEDNLMYTYQEGAVPLVCFQKDALPPGSPLAYSVSFIEQYFPNLYSGNILNVDPEFKYFPTLPHANEVWPMTFQYPPLATVTWNDWFDGMVTVPEGKKLQPGKFNLFSEPATKLRKGRNENFIWNRGRLIKATPKKSFGGGPAKLDGTIKMTPEDLKRVIEKGGAK